MEVKEEIATWLKQLQDSICTTLEKADGKSQFIEDNWQRKEGGGGRTRIIKDGSVIEKGGVLFSNVWGDAPEFLLKDLQKGTDLHVIGKKPQFYATGVSIVIHPVNPMLPIIHMNVRYFEADNMKWLGGGIDLTPHFIVEEDAVFFHSELKKVCNKHHPDYYSSFKKWADDYFFLPHRSETRGIGGIFFDRLSDNETMSFEKNLAFWKDVGFAFNGIYTELIERNQNKTYTEADHQWQLLRRGRYVEFNLLYDKGTRFGLESQGRVESILMSLPKLAGWEYNYQAEQGSREAHTLSLLKKGINWS